MSRSIQNPSAVAALAGVPLTVVLSGCVGVPFVVQETPAREACERYAQSFIDGETREEIVNGVEAAFSVARAASDQEAKRIADAIDRVLTQSVIGTSESLALANDAVIRACDDAGVTIEVVE